MEPVVADWWLGGISNYNNNRLIRVTSSILIVYNTLIGLSSAIDCYYTSFAQFSQMDKTEERDCPGDACVKIVFNSTRRNFNSETVIDQHVVKYCDRTQECATHRLSYWSSGCRRLNTMDSTIMSHGGLTTGGHEDPFDYDFCCCNDQNYCNHAGPSPRGDDPTAKNRVRFIVAAAIFTSSIISSVLLTPTSSTTSTSTLLPSLVIQIIIHAAPLCLITTLATIQTVVVSFFSSFSLSSRDKFSVFRYRSVVQTH